MAIAVDFDGTLSFYDHWRGVGIYGPPIPAMKERVLKWIAEGEEVYIFTSRVVHDGAECHTRAEREAIWKWLKQHGFPPLPITGKKLKKFTEYWDDRAIRVERNVG